jgi:alkaline phosphatase D
LRVRWWVRVCLIPLLALLPGLGFAAEPASPTRIAFGSCNHQLLPQPLWPVILDQQPDLWVWTGDIIYGDSADYGVLQSTYAMLLAQPGYEALKSSVPVIGVWDDHDYGSGEGGIDFPGKEASRRALLEFLEEPADSPRWTQPGIYTSYRLGSGDRQVHLILLDVRFNREHPGPEADILGAAQWRWLEAELGGPGGVGGLRDNGAALTVIVSGTQVLASEHRWDKWADYPKAKQRLLSLVRARAPNALFISGDRHIGELTRTSSATPVFYDITSSGLTHPWSDFPGEANSGRVGEVVTERHFGLLSLDWSARTVSVELINGGGQSVLRQILPMAPDPAVGND